MPLKMPNAEINRLAAMLARRTGVSRTDAIKSALENELRRLDEALSLRERVGFLEKRVNARPATGLAADKKFYDEIVGPT
jgi:antitoxin VapB